MRVWSVYTVTHRASRKVYVGVSYQVQVRWLQHQVAAMRGDDHPFYVLLKSDGPEAFDWVIVEEHTDRLPAYKRERQVMLEAGDLALNYVVPRKFPKPERAPWTPIVNLPPYGPPRRDEIVLQIISAIFAGGQRIMCRRIGMTTHQARMLWKKPPDQIPNLYELYTRVTFDA